MNWQNVKENIHKMYAWDGLPSLDEDYLSDIKQTSVNPCKVTKTQCFVCFY